MQQSQTQYFMIRKGLEIMSNTNSPLQSKDQIKSSNINLEYMDFIGKINLRIRDADTDVLNKVSAYLGYELPKNSGEVSTNDESRTAWLGPNEFLIQCAEDKKDNFIEDLNRNLNDCFYALTDVSDYYITIRLSGKKSIDVLEKGCPLNFKEYLKNKNTCAQSYISKGTVLIDRLSDDQVFDILIRWSFADYLWDWLSDSCSEFVD